jgi:carboxyl-terminal processing protease
MSEENNKPVGDGEMPVEDTAEINEVEAANETSDVEPPKKRTPIKISLGTFICSAIALVLAAVMLTYTVCGSIFRLKLAESKLDKDSNGSQQSAGSLTNLDIIREIFNRYSFEEIDDELVESEILKAYVHATGDVYAEYFTREEFVELQKQMAGVSQGIGISIINSSVTINDVEYKALKIISVMKNSPAEENGMMVGDCIITVGSEDNNTTVNKLNYDQALALLRGAAGTTAEFGFYRPSEGRVIFKSILRAPYETESVMSMNISNLSQKTGLVKILNFDETTPDQLVREVEALRAEGCEKFVFDLRYNPGGQLNSIAKILSFFLEKGDTIISMKDKLGNTETLTANVSEYYGITEEDIGRYRGMNAVVLCNESTASAAELFVANFRDHNLGEIVGTTTYGKGSVQTYINTIEVNGKKVYLDGVLKLTVYKYFPPCGEGYDGIGIEPKDECKVELSEEAKNKNIYDTMGTAEDNQLTEALKHLK